MSWFRGFAVLAFALGFAACTGLDDQEMLGELELNAKSGYSSLNFIDADTGKPFSLAAGRYRIDPEHGVFGFTHPKIKIHSLDGTLIGSLRIPRRSYNDDKTFEFYASDKDNTNAFNILGGRRKIVIDRKLHTKLKAYCTYTYNYPCQKTQLVTDLNGNTTTETYIGTCTETRSGERDELYALVTYKHVYRILFDAYDYLNVGQFIAESDVLIEKQLLAADSCE